ncbi:SAM-dependent methyltransferase [Mycolicibacterium anyangense]|uniref:SAM-dependent methyltransferase n=1 Tax=Mycolicibacterium anyangense TaxID=1431246 RepID=A0A6N4WBC2_9MYCO|nr:class I SAM-dependent methyltransferase [Mycolicibacterium anyangense]BBZ76491.1 SAM-dependent methyltransferase [Mycolicibacterium anyangense]
MTLDWDHNAFYHRRVLDELPVRCERVLDLGCGAGVLAAKLAGRADRVDALDRSPVMIEAARRVVGENVTCVLADIDDYGLAEDTYDAVVSVAALHHLRAAQVLPRLAAALRPGGVLVIVGLPARDLVGDWLTETASVVLNPVAGAVFAALRRLTGRSWFAHDSTHDLMPVQGHAPLTTRQLGQLAHTVLPGSSIRRLLFWRYLLVWHKPPG